MMLQGLQMLHRRQRRQLPGSSGRGFTLVEMLVVVAITAMLLSLIVPAVDRLVRGSSLTQSGDIIVGFLAQARQNAMTRNAPVEVRLYQYVDPTLPMGSSAQGVFRSLQAFWVDEMGACTPLGKAETMPGAVLIDSGSQLSPLLNEPGLVKSWSATDPQIKIPRAETNYQCVAFRFRPDGSTTLPATGGAWYVTLHNATEGDGLSSGDIGPGGKVQNYVCLQIDPISGAVKLHRP